MAHILYIAQFFSMESEPGGQGQRHYKHANALAEAGHHVTVLTSGNTTMQLYRRQKPESGNFPASLWMHPNLNIIKLPVDPMNKRSVVSRAWRYLGFGLKALTTGLKLLLIERRQFHFVLGSSPPLLIALVAYVLSVLARAEFLMEVRDLWSQTMAANGFINNQFVIRMNRWLESQLYQKAGKIIVVSKAFAQEIEAQVPNVRHKIQYIPNGADLEFFQYPKLWQGSFLRHREQDEAVYNVVYAGVFSDYTHLETILEAALLMRQKNPAIRFNLIGGGYQLDKLRAMADDLALENVLFWDALPKNRISKFIMEGDLSIINYRNLDIFGQVLPNKLFDYLAAGRPILAAVPDGEVSTVLAESGAGLVVEAENAEAMVEKIMWFYQHQELGYKMGLLGRDYVQRKFNRELLVLDFLNLFPRIIPLAPYRRREAGSLIADRVAAPLGRAYLNL